MQIMRAFASLVLLVGLNGCLTLPNSYSNSGTNYQSTAVHSQEMITCRRNQEEMRRELASLRADLRGMHEHVQRLHGQMQLLQQAQSAASGDEATRLANSERALRQELEQLRGELAAERRTREQALNKVVDTVSAEISRTTGELAAQQQRLATQAAARTAASAVQGTYEVQRGDTLSIIARAYGISTTALMQANNLSDTVIRVGQKLIIPAP